MSCTPPVTPALEKPSAVMCTHMCTYPHTAAPKYVIKNKRHAKQKQSESVIERKCTFALRNSKPHDNGIYKTPSRRVDMNIRRRDMFMTHFLVQMPTRTGHGALPTVSALPRQRREDS